MTQPNPTPETKKRSPWVFALGGCLVLVVCVILALAANAVYWSTRMWAGDDSLPVPQTGQIKSQAAALPEGNGGSGEDIFEENGCANCHSLQPGARGAGPSLNGVADRAASERDGYSAKEYLYESIVAPRAHTVQGFPPGVMPDRYNRLSDQEVADLVAFLMEQ